MQGRSPTGAAAGVVLVFSLLLLNASLTFENVWPTPAVTWGWTLSIELAAILLLVALAPRQGRRLAGWILPAAWVVLVFGRYVDVTAPGLYGRELNLYWDSQHLGNVAAMLGRVASWWTIAGAAGVLALGLVAAFALARLALRRIADAAQRPGPRAGLGATAGALVLLFACEQAFAGFDSGLPFADPVTPAYVRQARFAAGMIAPGIAAPPLASSPRLEYSLAGLGGADVLLVFVESYGAVTFEDREISAELSPSRAALADAIAATGRRVASAYVESPTFGGSSWLAHLTLISGVDVRDQYAYTSLMASRRDTMLTTFQRNGYKVVALMPGMRQAWPEGAFYRFDAIYGREALSYQGPEFGWWGIPDQYALAKLDVLERDRPSRAPLLAVFPTSTTHAPFGPVPPYQPDWPRILTDHPFDDEDVERTMAAVPDYLDLRPSYVAAMSYAYRAFAGYLRQRADDRMVMILIGDHQPPSAVAGKDAPWTVPVHVITHNGHVLEGLAEAGFGADLTPRRPPVGPMHALVPLLLDAFARPDS